MEKEPHVGLFIDNYPPAVDGVAVCVENYAHWIKSKYGDVTVVTPHVKGADYSHFDYSIVNYLSLPIPGRHPYVMGMSAFDPIVRARVGKTPFRILHAHSPFSAGWIAVSIAKRQNIPLVATFHSKYREDFSRLLPRPLFNYMMWRTLSFYNTADEVWVPQESVKEVLRSYGYKGHVEVLENGSDLVKDYPESFYTESRKRLGIAPDEFVLLFVGQHIWEKGTKLIIDALSGMHDVPFRMFFIGEGYAALDMKMLVEKYGLEDKVSFIGPVLDRELLTSYYASANLFLFPSMYDNAPLVVKEAAALHTPAVMVEGATASAIIRDGENGFLVKPDKASLEARLRELSRNPELVKNAGDGASKTVVRPWEDCVDDAVDRYNHLLRRRGLEPIVR